MGEPRGNVEKLRADRAACHAGIPGAGTEHAASEGPRGGGTPRSGRRANEGGRGDDREAQGGARREDSVNYLRLIQDAFYDWTREMSRSKRVLTWVGVLLQGYAFWAAITRSLI